METNINKNLATAIIAVMKDVKGIDKNMKIGTGGSSYNGVSDQDVKKIIGDSMARNGLCILPIEVSAKTDTSRWEEVSNGYTKQKQSTFTEVSTKYLLMHESGESQIIAGYGHGVDSQDKAAGKATTYALKYALLYSFLIPTGKIDDADNTHSDEIPVPIKAIKPKEKLVANSDKFKNAVMYLKENGTMDKIKSKYEVTDEIEKLLINAVL